MHLIVLTDRPDRSTDAAETSLFRVCEGLAGRGHSITLLYRDSGDYLPKYAQFCSHLMRVQSLSVYGRKSLVKAAPSILADAFRLPQLCYDGVYANRYQTVWAGILLSRVHGAPLVCHHRDTMPQRISAMWPALFWNVHTHLFPSGYLKSSWEAFVPVETSAVVPSGVPDGGQSPAADLRIFRRRFKVTDDEKIALYSGALAPDHGIETLLEAYARAARGNKQMKLWLAGTFSSGEYEDSLHTRCAKLGIIDGVRFLDDRYEGSVLYRMVDVAIFPNLSDEASGSAVVEAMACGTPVLASRVGGFSEVLTGTLSRSLFRPGDADDLARRLGSVIDWRQKEPSLGLFCREHALRNFSFDGTLDGVEQAFRNSREQQLIPV